MFIFHGCFKYSNMIPIVKVVSFKTQLKENNNNNIPAYSRLCAFLNP